MRLTKIGVFLLAAGSASAQCQWLPGEGIAGVSGMVVAAAAWDPDGQGPLPDRAVIAGNFVLAGETVTERVAAWDGAAWHAMPVPQGTSLRGLSTVDGELFAGTQSGVLRWNGSSWEALGGAVGAVNAVAAYGGALYAGGVFPNSQTPTHWLVRWTGTAWEPVAGGPDGEVKCLLVDGSTLVVGGQFSNVGPAGAPVPARGVARFDGQVFSAIGPGQALNGYVLAAAAYGGRLFAAGNFSIAGQSGRSIASFDGANWSITGGGVSSTVYSLLVHGGMLAAGGTFGSAGGLPGTAGFVRWNGAQWVPSGGLGIVYAMASQGADLVAGGSTAFLGGVPVRNVGRFDGSQWHPMGSGLPSAVLAMAVLDGELVISMPAGVTYATGRVLRRSGGQWQPLGGWFNATPEVLTAHNGALYAGGNFSTIDGVGVQRVVRLDGNVWVNVGPGGPAGPVQSLGSFGGDLVVGGVFATVGGVPARRIARFDGAGWSAFGAGLGSATISGDTGIKALATFQNQLVAGGRFGELSGWANIARWDGAAWQPMGVLGTSENYSVRSLAVYRGEVYAAGLLSGIGPQGRAVARWDGAAWQPVGGVGYPPLVSVLAADDDYLYAGGTFTTIGGIPAQNIARWNGQAWTALDGGLLGVVNALQIRDGGLDAGGGFYLADGRPSASYARWECGACYANCDGSAAPPVLNVNDFICFQTRFAAGDPYANCDGSTIPPVLNVNDFLCFQGRFAAGCP